MASLTNEPLLILAALVTVYIVLGVLYESYIHPITILSTLPSAGVGALLALMVCHAELTVVAIIGIVLLIGIVKKNAIMMIDFALEAEREQGKNPYDAIFQASLLRFRPIMMTTMAAFWAQCPWHSGKAPDRSFVAHWESQLSAACCLASFYAVHHPCNLSFLRRSGAKIQQIQEGRGARPGTCARGRGLTDESFVAFYQPAGCYRAAYCGGRPRGGGRIPAIAGVATAAG